MYPSLDDLSSTGERLRSQEEEEVQFQQQNLQQHHVQQQESLLLSAGGIIRHPSLERPAADVTQSSSFDHDSVACRQRLASNFETLKKRKRESAQVTQHHVHVATETAGLAAMEIERMTRAIADLESLLRHAPGETAPASSPQPPPPSP
jgi:hypothetical protein